MEIFVSGLIAYFLIGIGQAAKDLGGNAIDRPMWAMNPTPGKIILVSLTWPSRPILEAMRPSGQLARAIAFGSLNALIQLATLTALVWVSYYLAGLVFEAFILQLALSAVIAFLGSLFVLPLAALILTPVTFILSWPLDLLFPLKSRIKAKEINWCRTCKHYRKIDEYEDTFKGLCQSVSMPRSDKLPCKIILETAPIWEEFYEMEPKSRSLFPKDCSEHELA